MENGEVAVALLFAIIACLCDPSQPKCHNTTQFSHQQQKQQWEGRAEVDIPETGTGAGVGTGAEAQHPLNKSQTH